MISAAAVLIAGALLAASSARQVAIAHPPRRPAVDPLPEALVLYDRSCRGGSAQGCASYGVALGDTPARAAEQRAAFERACTLKDGPGCAHLAYLYAGGDGVTRDHARATSLYEQACRLPGSAVRWPARTSAVSCRATRSARPIRPVDESRAAQYFESGCTAGDAESCYEISLRLTDGRGVPRAAAREHDAGAGLRGGLPQGVWRVGGPALTRLRLVAVTLQVDGHHASGIKHQASGISWPDVPQDGLLHGGILWQPAVCGCRREAQLVPCAASG